MSSENIQEWSELPPYQKDEFTQMLQGMGLDVDVEGAREYYGNKAKVLEDVEG